MTVHEEEWEKEDIKNTRSRTRTELKMFIPSYVYIAV